MCHDSSPMPLRVGVTFLPDRKTDRHTVRRNVHYRGDITGWLVQWLCVKSLMMVIHMSVVQKLLVMSVVLIGWNGLLIGWEY